MTSISFHVWQRIESYQGVISDIRVKFFSTPLLPVGRRVLRSDRSIARGGGQDGDGTGQLGGLLQDGVRTNIEQLRKLGKRMLYFLSITHDPVRIGPFGEVLSASIGDARGSFPAPRFSAEVTTSDFRCHAREKRVA